ncbi:hypothetical protein ACB092_04G023900 [Castanea dentata]
MALILNSFNFNSLPSVLALPSMRSHLSPKFSMTSTHFSNTKFRGAKKCSDHPSQCEQSPSHATQDN